MPIPVAAIGLGISLASKIFGGKDYVSAVIGIYGGGGNRDMSWVNQEPAYAAYHYNQVVKRLGQEGLSSVTTAQRRAFWDAWDSTNQLDFNTYTTTNTNTNTNTAVSKPVLSGFNNPLIMLALIGAGLYIVLKGAKQN